MLGPAHDCRSALARERGVSANIHATDPPPSSGCGQTKRAPAPIYVRRWTSGVCKSSVGAWLVPRSGAQRQQVCTDFSLIHRVHRFHDRFPADRGTSHAPTEGFCVRCRCLARRVPVGARLPANALCPPTSMSQTHRLRPDAAQAKRAPAPIYVRRWTSGVCKSSVGAWLVPRSGAQRPQVCHRFLPDPPREPIPRPVPGRSRDKPRSYRGFASNPGTPRTCRSDRGGAPPCPRMHCVCQHRCNRPSPIANRRALA